MTNARCNVNMKGIWSRAKSAGKWVDRRCGVTAVELLRWSDCGGV